MFRERDVLRRIVRVYNGTPQIDFDPAGQGKPSQVEKCRFAVACLDRLAARIWQWNFLLSISYSNSISGDTVSVSALVATSFVTDTAATAVVCMSGCVLLRVVSM